VFISCGFVHYLVFCSGPLDTLIIFTTTISVSSIRVQIFYSSSYSVLYNGCCGCNFVFYYSIKENTKTSATESLGLDEFKQNEPWFDAESLSFLMEESGLKFSGYRIQAKAIWTR